MGLILEKVSGAAHPLNLRRPQSVVELMLLM
jgi:hypothetical protein